MTNIEKLNAVCTEYTKHYIWDCEHCPLRTHVDCISIKLFSGVPTAEENKLISAVYGKLFVLPAVTETDILSILSE